MAATAIASKVGGLSSLTKGVTGSSKLLAVAAFNKASSANIHSKTSGNLEPRLKPWDYKKYGFDYVHSLFDGTTKRFTDNSKLLVVEGPPALGKTEFAKALADELDMKFVPGFTMEDFYINSYGYDLRELDYKIQHDRVKSFDEKKFAQNPTGQDGGLDRMLFNLHMCRYMQHVDLLAHIFNTGEGVVTERSPHSDWVYFDAAYQQGWIDRSTKSHYYRMRDLTIDQVLRPNLIIYLDAPVDVVQSKIRERSKTTHPWEANSPVWENTEYLENLYGNLMKKQYLKLAAESSMVLQYDWSEGGDTEVVVEDIERLNMDYHDKYDKQQKDWRLLTEDGFASKRNLYTHKGDLLSQWMDPFWNADKLIWSSAEGLELEKIKMVLPGNEYRAGFNTILGDPEPFFNFKFGIGREKWYQDAPYHVENAHGDPQMFHEDKLRKSRKAAGMADWWKV
eukprot:GFUD01035932.1.p1 GENE.GFUD01035932.1~~GFUD01035932.1.p1  ORF type:complete len:450 (-),score=126.34 GFUD01035932.1:127-1476(-)